MIGWVYAMKPADYQAWLAGGVARASPSLRPAPSGSSSTPATPATADQPGARGPSLSGSSASPSGCRAAQTVMADEAYIRESIVNPQAKLVEGYPPIMPTFQGLISEEGLLQLTAYIKSLSPAPVAAPRPRPERTTPATP